MFKNKIIEATPPAVNTAVLNGESPSAVARKPATTVIASGIRFDGNIIAEGDVDIYGTVSGNIDARESQIKIMTGGLVEGNITCRELVIDGCVIGQCRSETIEIDKNGNVTGTLAYRTLTIKRAVFFRPQNCCRRQIRATSWGLSRIPLLKLKIRLRRSSSHPGAAEKAKKPAPGWLK